MIHPPRTFIYALKLSSASSMTSLWRNRWCSSLCTTSQQRTILHDVQQNHYPNKHQNLQPPEHVLLEAHVDNLASNDHEIHMPNKYYTPLQPGYHDLAYHHLV
ncbi:hypothetical protein V6N11_001178 [Hibiscus sabdariffa]|uniref:Uncharacterized protein n=1 Tax=Hibiscus sabdariffa TaxID=183260 RepID=A0ABR2RZS0_9ROSI